MRVSKVSAVSSKASDPTSVGKHLPVLDGIRAVAVLMVICFHFWRTCGSPNTFLIGRLAVWGQTGVHLFFVLSGFLITGILLDAKGSEHFLRNFYLRRMLRIFPLYYAALIAVYLLCPLLHLHEWISWKQSIWYWVYLQNIPETFAPALASGPPHFWSLAVEEHYYLFWPFMVLMFTRDRLLKLVGVVIVVSLLTRIVLIRYETFYFTLARLDALAIGSALAIFSRGQSGGLARFAGWAKGLLIFVGPALVITQMPASSKDLSIIEISKSTLIAVTYACVMILAIEGKIGRRLGNLLSGRVLGSIGKYSYGMYVLHPFVLTALHKAGFHGGVLWLPVSIVLTYVAAWISWTLIEKRFLALKRYFEYAADTPALPATPLVAVES